MEDEDFFNQEEHATEMYVRHQLEEGTVSEAEDSEDELEEEQTLNVDQLDNDS